MCLTCLSDVDILLSNVIILESVSANEKMVTETKRENTQNSTETAKLELEKKSNIGNQNLNQKGCGTMFEL